MAVIRTFRHARLVATASPGPGKLFYGAGEYITEQKKIRREQNFKQAGELFRGYDRKTQDDLIASLGGALAEAEDESKHIMLSYFYKTGARYGEGLAKVAEGDLERVRALAAGLSD